MNSQKYLTVFTVPFSVAWALFHYGIQTFLPVVLLFVLVPLIELLLKPDHSNPKAMNGHAKACDIILYLTIPVNIFLLIVFFFQIQESYLDPISYVGRIVSMGVMLGVVGINSGHELGHRRERWAQRLAEVQLMPALETHFLPYHNLGHHKDVATYNDPATARHGEWLYKFVLRSQWGSYWQAWRLEIFRLKCKERPFFHKKNRMLNYTIVQVLLLAGLYFVFGLDLLFAFISVVLIAKFLLETVNYIEHYGLRRRKLSNGKYESVKPEHSWNSDHPIGRMVLFELSRHSDHHIEARKRFQSLNSWPESPQMPTGYPGMMLLALIPYLWFKVMKKQLENQCCESS